MPDLIARVFGFLYPDTIDGHHSEDARTGHYDNDRGPTGNTDEDCACVPISANVLRHRLKPIKRMSNADLNARSLLVAASGGENLADSKIAPCLWLVRLE